VKSEREKEKGERERDEERERILPLKAPREGEEFCTSETVRREKGEREDRISAVFDLQSSLSLSLVLSTERTRERFVSHSSGGCFDRSNLTASKVRSKVAAALSLSPFSIITHIQSQSFIHPASLSALIHLSLSLSLVCMCCMCVLSSSGLLSSLQPTATANDGGRLWLDGQVNTRVAL
jgi:hypothetical protein